MRVLVTGSTGYVGGRLVPALLAAGHDVRTTVTDPDDVPQTWWRDRVDTVPMDILDADQVDDACAGMDAVYHLVHGMGGDDFVETDRRAAGHVVDAVTRHGVDRVVYLSGIVPEVPEDELSDHISSRSEVERILTGSPATVITLRAAIVLGSGSTSFEIVRQVSERLPAQTVPDWMDSQVQPIAVVDVVAALVGALTVPGPSRHVDVGGPERMAYGDLLSRYADLAGLTRPQVTVPLLPTDLVGVLVAQLTDVPDPVVRALVESLHHDMVCSSEETVLDLLPPGHELVGFDEAVRRSLAADDASPEERDPMAPMPQDPHWAGGGDARPVLARAVDGAASLVRAVTRQSG